MYVRGLSIGMRPLTWYRVFDDAVAGSPEDAYPDRTCGLLRIDDSIKPAYTAYQVLADELARSYYREVLPWPDTEGYVFDVGSSREKYVLWSTGLPKDVAFPAACLRQVGLLGTQRNIVDGGTGDLDGQSNGLVTVRLQQNDPIYVERCH
jgi:hypothetical protein